MTRGVGEAPVYDVMGATIEFLTPTPSGGEFVHIPPNARHAHRNRSSAAVVEIVITAPDLGRFFIEVGKVVPASGALPPPTAEDVRRFVTAAARHHHWLATPSENSAVGLAMP
jgi:hypothetical protein